MKLRSKIHQSHTNKKRRISFKALLTMLFYLVIPVIAILVIMNNFPELSDDRLIIILQRIIPIGIVLILIAQYQVRFPRGDKKRLLFNELYVLVGALWLIILVGGGPVIYQTWEEYRFSLHIWRYLILIFFVMALNIVFYLVEYYTYKDEVAEEKTDEGVIITDLDPEPSSG